MNTKKFFSFLLAAQLALGLSVVALSDDEDRGRVLKDSGLSLADPGEENQTPPIGETVFNVSIPSDLSFVLDPFEKLGRGQIYSEPLTVRNNGEDPVTVTIQDARCLPRGRSSIRFLNLPQSALRQVFDSGEPETTTAEERAEERDEERAEERDEKPAKRNRSKDKPSPTDSGPPPVEQPESKEQTTSDDGQVLDSGAEALLRFSESLFPVSAEKELLLYLRRVDQPGQRVIVISMEPARPYRFVLEGGEEAVFEVGGVLNPMPDSPWEKGELSLSATFVVDPIAPKQTRLEE